MPATKMLPVAVKHPAWCDPSHCRGDGAGMVCHFSNPQSTAAATGEALGVQLTRGDSADEPGAGQPTTVDLLAFPEGAHAAAILAIPLDLDAARTHVAHMQAAIAAAEAASNTQ